MVAHLELVDLPYENRAIVTMLYHIEVGLRGLIIDELEKAAGYKWWKQRVPGNIREEAEKLSHLERNTTWLDLISHHPIFYTNFSEVSAIILRNDNWEESFRSIFRDKKRFEFTLRELEPIRNTVAPNRLATVAEMRAVEHSYRKLANQVGCKRFAYLYSKPKLVTNLREKLDELYREEEEEFANCASLRPVGALSAWIATKRAWWFDQGYLGIDVAPVETMMDMLDAYSKLPRLRGCAYVLDEWVRDRDLQSLHHSSQEVFRSLLDSQ
jgi:hypothetical protein